MWPNICKFIFYMSFKPLALSLEDSWKPSLHNHKTSFVMLPLLSLQITYFRSKIFCLLKLQLTQFTHCFFLLTFHFLLLGPITWLSLFPRAKSRGRFAWPKWSPPSVASLSTGVFGSDVHPWCHHLQPETGEQISCCLNMGLSPLAGTGRKVLWGCCANLESGAWKAVWRER